MSTHDEQISDLLSNIHSIAAVGVTNHPSTPGYEVLSYQQSQGYNVIPVNPNVESILGKPCFTSVGAIAQPVDLINVFTAGAPLSEAVDAAITSNAKAVWLQPGVSDETAEDRARMAGVKVIKNKCFQREHRRLLGDKPM